MVALLEAQIFMIGEILMHLMHQVATELDIGFGGTVARPRHTREPGVLAPTVRNHQTRHSKPRSFYKKTTVAFL